MLTHDFELTGKSYEELNIKERFIMDMISYRAEREFYSQAREVIWQRNKDKRLHEWDKNDEITYEDFGNCVEIAITAEHALLKVYKSIYGELTEETNKEMDKIAKNLADHRLKICGWKKKMEIKTPIINESHVVEKVGEYKGIRYVVALMSLGHRCGYVAVPKGHRYYKDKDYDCMNINCHGGITYSGDEYPLDDGNWYIGFDTAHWGDGKDLDALLKYYSDSTYVKVMLQSDTFCNGNVWSIDDIEKECKSIIDQLKGE
jgi:hypothetical protein